MLANLKSSCNRGGSVGVIPVVGGSVVLVVIVVVVVGVDGGGVGVVVTQAK